MAEGVTAIVWTDRAWDDGHFDFWDAKLSIGLAWFVHAITVGLDRFAAGKAGILFASLFAGVAAASVLGKGRR